MEGNEEQVLIVPDATTDCVKTVDEDEINENTSGWSKANVLWRGLNFSMACFFAMAAYVQLNDPDPVVWMFVYVVPACLCISTAFSPDVQDHVVWQSLATADIFGSLAGAIYLATTIRPQMQNDSINNPLVLEEGREMSGLIIIMLWISLCKFVTWFSQRKGNVPILFWISILVLCFIPFSLWAYCYRNLDRRILPGHCKDML